MIFLKELFYTYSPDETFTLNKEWRDGQGKLWIMKKIKPATPTQLLNGGKVSCWKVYGKRK